MQISHQSQIGKILGGLGENDLEAVLLFMNQNLGRPECCLISAAMGKRSQADFRSAGSRAGLSATQLRALSMIATILRWLLIYMVSNLIRSQW
uniref:Uncharacterized protein n=1 Tax=Ditylenchus dipsaci TaxID=166011 RepID=A0A915D836_9BILA